MRSYTLQIEPEYTEDNAPWYLEKDRNQEQ